MSIRMGDVFMKQALTALSKRSCRKVLHTTVPLILGFAAAGAQAAQPTNGIGNPMLHNPQLPHLQVQMTYNPQLTKLWYQALQQDFPEVISKTCEALCVAVKNKVPDIQSLVPLLEHQAVSKAVPAGVRTSVAKTLAFMGDRHTESFLAHLDASAPHAFALVLDPILARWHNASMGGVWLARLKSSATTPQIRASAARALGVMRDYRAETLLKKIVVNAESPLILRFAAAKSLAMLDARGLVAVSKKLLEVHRHLIVTRLLCADALSAANGTAQRKILLTLAADHNSAVAAIAWRALIIHDVNSLQPLTEPMSRNADPTIRMLVARAWRCIGGNKSITGLGATLNDRRRPIRWYARDALIFLGSESGSRSAVINTCRTIIRGHEPRAIRQACLVLGKLDDKASAQDFVSLLDNKSQAVRLGAVVALRRVAVRNTLPKVLIFAENTAKSSQFASANLRKAGFAALRNDDNLQLSQAFQFFGLMHYRPALPVLIPCIPKNAPYGVEARQAAIWAIGMIDDGQSHPRLANELAGRLDDMEMPIPEFEQVRQMSAITLGRIKSKAHLTDLNASFSSDDIGSLSLACRWAIGQITGKVPPLPHATSLFQTGFLVPLSQH